MAEQKTILERDDTRQEKGNKKRKRASSSVTSGSDPSEAKMPQLAASDSSASCESIVLNKPLPMFPSSQILKKYVIFEEDNYWSCRSCQHRSNGHPNRIIAHLTRIPSKGIKVCPKIRPEKMEELRRELGLFGLPSFNGSDMGITSSVMWLPRGVGDQGIQSLKFQRFVDTPWTQHSGASQFPSVNRSNSVIPSSLSYPSKAQLIRTFLPSFFSKLSCMPAVKSVCFQRYQDISKFTSYNELCNELAHMFGLEGQFEDPRRSRWLLVFFDRANDVLIVGDDPWWIMKETSRIIEEKPGTIKHLVLNVFCVAVQHMVREEIEVSLSEGKIWNLKNPEKSTGSTSFQHDDPEQNTSFSDLISSLLETRSPPTPPKRCTRLSHDQEGDDVLNTNNGEFPGTNAVGSKIISTIHQPEQMVIPLDETYSVEAILEDIDDEVQETNVVESMINNTMDQGRSFQLDSTRVSSPQVGIIVDMGDPMPPLLHDGDQFYTPSFENAFGVGTVTGYDLVDPPPCPQGFDSDLSEIYIGTNIWRSSWWDNENLEPYN